MDQVTLAKFLFAIVTLGIGFAVITYLRGLPARLAIAALVLGVMLLGPQVFGRDWYFDGFIAGFFIGDFYGTADAREQSVAARMEQDSKEVETEEVPKMSSQETKQTETPSAPPKVTNEPLDLANTTGQVGGPAQPAPHKEKRKRRKHRAVVSSSDK